MNKEWTVSGYGINMFDEIGNFLPLDKDRLDKLMENAPETREFADDYLEGFEPEDRDDPNIYDDIEDDSCNRGPAMLLCKIINEIEGLSLEAHNAENGDFILFVPMYPWSAKTERDEQMTPQKLDEIFAKYAGVKGDYQEAEYCG